VVRVVNARTIVVLTVPPIEPEKLTETLKVASGKIRHTWVVPAKVMADITAAGDGSRILYGTVGLVQFPKTQPQTRLERARRLVAALVVEHEIGLLI